MNDTWDEGEVGDLEDEYTLLGELGRGGSAVVYRARDRVLFRDVAIKVVRPKFAASAEDAIARLAREARTVARLQHPNIVTVHAVKRLRDGGLALVMQLVPGRTLKQAIQDDGPFPAERAERVLRDVAEALAFAHANGVVHRDVKPENIFIESGSGRALLSDFGIAYSSEYESRLTMTGAAIGTPAYMAPEQIDGTTANARSDLYSLGLVAWEMLTGERPWEGEALYNVIFKQKNEQLPAIDELRPGEVPPRLQYIIERMLQKKPAARWAGADGVLTALNNWVVPSDWRQWEESHRRRRELAKQQPRAKAVPKDATGDATVRFARPADGVLAAPGGADAAVLLKTPVTAAVVEPEDDAPSWATETPTPSRRWLWVGVVALAVMVSTGAFAMFARQRGLFTTRTAPPAVQSDGRTVELPVVASADTLSYPRDSAAMRLRADSLRIDSLRADSLLRVAALAQRSVDSVRADSMAAAAMWRAQRRAARLESAGAAAGGTTSAAAVASAPRVDAVRATDDAGIIAAGGRHSCAIVSAKVLCWGANGSGQLGDGELESRDAPAPIVGDLDFVQVTTGRAHTCGLARGGEAYCWGADDKGQLGDATTTSRSAPVRVAGSQSFRTLRAGSSHTCGLTASGDAACWGDNSNGQLGDGSVQTRSSPVSVAGGQRFVSLSAGSSHTCGIASDGSAWCWGANASGQLGNGTRTDARTPTAVSPVAKFTSISAANSHTCAVSDSGEVWCWGRNSFGQLGNGSSTDQGTPVRVESSVRFVSVSAGGVHSCARTRSGQAWCWGRNVYGQLGDGTNVNRDVPTRVIGNSVYSSVNATGAHTCGTATDGETTCWGWNVEGQLGDGTRNHHARPTRVVIPGR
jgi:alpha-tubulin suppressor-like RCC1 family protein